MAISLESNLNVISVEIFLNSFFVYSICRSSLPAAMGVRARELISMEFSRVSRRRSEFPACVGIEKMNVL